MQQSDYILREIEKIGLVINAIRNKIFGGKDNTTITNEIQISDTKDILLNDIDLDLDKFLCLTSKDTTEFISRHSGFNIENMESLAELLSKIGFGCDSDHSKLYLEKALLLYEICSIKDRMYSINRENNIIKIKEAIIQYQN